MQLKRPVIIEGPDGAGKSTLAKRLAVHLGVEVFHSGGPPMDIKHLQLKMDKIKKNYRSHVIDRTPHISEPIYAPVNGRRVFIPIDVLHKELSDLKPLIIYCRLKSAVDMFKAIDRSKKLHKSPEHLREVMEQYSKVVQKYDADFGVIKNLPGVDVIQYDWNLSPIAKLLGEVEKCAV